LITAGIALLAISFQLVDGWSTGIMCLFALLLCSLLFWAVRFFQVRDQDPSAFFAGVPAAALGLLRRKNGVKLEDQPGESA